MNKNKPSFLVILPLILATIIFIADIGGAYSAWIEFVNWISDNTSLKLNDYTTKLLLFIVIIILGTILYQLIVLMTKNKQTSLLDKKKIRENYLNWFGNYVKDRLDSSIHTALFIYLNKKEELGKVEPWTYQYQETNLEGREELNIIDDFLVRIEKNRGRILLLGAPGCGKTTTLFKIADLLYEKAKEDSEKPIPLILNLSTWGNSKVWFDKKSKSKKYLNQDEYPDIETWIIEELGKIKGLYINSQIANTWIEKKKFIFLLDGLDESKEALRTKLVVKLNEFFSRYAETTIVCSRIEDYNALIESNSIKLDLNAAITIQPLSDEQIEEYLDKAKAEVVKGLIREDSELFKIARIPLNLSIMVFTYGGNYLPIKSNNLISGTLLRLDLFSKFVKKMIEWKEVRAMSNNNYPETIVITKQEIPPQIIEKINKEEEKVNKYLSWIAKRMSESLENSFRPNDLFSYVQNYNEDGVWNPINIAKGLLLFILSICLTFVSHFNTFYFEKEYALFLIPFLIIIYYYLYLFIDQNSFVKNEFIGNIILMVGSWFIILAFFIYVFGGLNYLFSSINLGTIIGVILAICLIGINIFVIRLNKEEGFKSFPFLIFLSSLLLSALFISIFYFNEPPISTSIFLSLLIVGLFLTDHHDSSENYNFLSIILFLIALISSFFEPRLSALFTLFGFLLFLLLRNYIFNILDYHFKIKIFLEPFINFYLRINGIIPFKLQNFINYNVNTLLLRRNQTGFEFSHRYLRDYFAINNVILSFDAQNKISKEYIIEELVNLRDASCDVLLELVNDDDKDVRIACIKGLGIIGTNQAAQVLIKIINSTERGVRDVALESLKYIYDVGSIPHLIYFMNSYSKNSIEYKTVLHCLIRMNKLDAINDSSELERLFHNDDFREAALYALFNKYPDLAFEAVLNDSRYSFNSDKLNNFFNNDYFVSKLIEITNSKDNVRRERAISILTQLKMLSLRKSILIDFYYGWKKFRYNSHKTIKKFIYTTQKYFSTWLPLNLPFLYKKEKIIEHYIQLIQSHNPSIRDKCKERIIKGNHQEIFLIHKFNLENVYFNNEICEILIHFAAKNNEINNQLIIFFSKLRVAYVKELILNNLISISLLKQFVNDINCKIENRLLCVDALFNKNIEEDVLELFLRETASNIKHDKDIRLESYKILLKYEVRGIIPELLSFFYKYYGFAYKKSLLDIFHFFAKYQVYELIPFFIDYELKSKTENKYREDDCLYKALLDKFFDKGISLDSLLLKIQENSFISIAASYIISIKWKNEAVLEIIKLIYNPVAEIRYAAVFGLGIIGNARCIEHLERLLDDNTEVKFPVNANLLKVNTMVIDALEKIGTKSAKQVLDNWKLKNISLN